MSEQLNTMSLQKTAVNNYLQTSAFYQIGVQIAKSLSTIEVINGPVLSSWTVYFMEIKTNLVIFLVFFFSKETVFTGLSYLLVNWRLLLQNIDVINRQPLQLQNILFYYLNRSCFFFTNMFHIILKYHVIICYKGGNIYLNTCMLFKMQYIINMYQPKTILL